VSGPKLVSEIDWIENVWPKELMERQKDLDRIMPERDDGFSTYPKVQRYCLISVAGCFTEFHIGLLYTNLYLSKFKPNFKDFGGTSVWYHILKGEKVKH
jgi:F-box and leucine-rich repeat protein 10/11